MKNLFFAVTISVVLSSCEVDHVSSGTYLLDNQSSYDVVVVLKHEEMDAEISKRVLKNTLDTMYEIHTDPSVPQTPLLIDYIRVYSISENADEQLLYEQNQPIDETPWNIDRKYYKGRWYHTVNTFVFTDDMAQI